MVYLHFPLQLTEEEEMLQKKYQKLRRKKKALQMLKAPKQEPPAPKPLQSNLEAKPDAKEVAKKLLKSGAISAIKVENKERQGFKRPKGLERKRSASDRSGVAGYQPFSASHSAEEDHGPTSASSSPSTNQTAAIHKPAVKKLIESFVSARDLTEPEIKEERIIKDRDRRERNRDGRMERAQQGNTVYVHGYGVTQEILEKTLKSVGNIVNISMEMDKNCGFVTFEKMEDADKAIKTMSGVMTDGVQLTISLARRQPLIPPINDESSSSWGCLAANFRQKGGHEDCNRQLIVYDI